MQYDSLTYDSQFDRTQHNLHKCHVTVYYGFIFVCLSPDAPPDFADEGETAFVFNPTNYILAFNDFALMVRFTPRDTVNTDVQFSWLVHKDAEEGVDYDTDNLIRVWDVTTKQDKKNTEDNNAGIMSSRYRPGPYSMHETRVATFIRWYLNAIRLPA